MPTGLEIVVKLMVIGELASAVCQPQYAYRDRVDAPSWSLTTGTADRINLCLVEVTSI